MQNCTMNTNDAYTVKFSVVPSQNYVNSRSANCAFATHDSSDARACSKWQVRTELQLKAMAGRESFCTVVRSRLECLIGSFIFQVMHFAVSPSNSSPHRSDIFYSYYMVRHFSVLHFQRPHIVLWFCMFLLCTCLLYFFYFCAASYGVI